MMACCCLFLLIAGFGTVVTGGFLILCVILRIGSTPLPKVKRYDSEKYFADPSVPSSRIAFPSLFDTPTIKLSVVVPAYDEEKRLPVMLKDSLEDYLEVRQKNDPAFTYEVIVVDDGSKDKTTQVALQYTKKYGSDKFRVLKLEHNRGKGGAVRLGVLSARGEHILFADADGATKFVDLDKLNEEMRRLEEKSESAIVIGSRAHLEKEAIATRSVFRTILMIGFHFLVWFFAVREIKDTQCGFKLFTRKAAQRLFPNLHVERWAFDVELLYLAQKLRIPISEVAVNWTEIEGSKVVPVWSWLQMGKDLMLIWLKYFIGAWKFVDNLKKE